MSVLAQAAVEPSAAHDTAAGSVVVPLVFFVSGMPALIYQLIWQRALFTMYGVNIEAVTVVVAGFLLGLGFAAPSPGAALPAAFIEDCGGVLARTRGLPLITDDNMAGEWRSLVTTDPLMRRLRGLFGKSLDKSN